jgi:hypothetical protein
VCGTPLEELFPVDVRAPGADMNLLSVKLAVGLVAVVATGMSTTITGSSQSSSTGPSKERAQGVPANATGAATKAFLDRIREYVTFHNNVQKMVPPLTETDNPEKIATREKALGDALIKQRPNAKPGDFYIKEYQPILRQIIREDFMKRSLADRKALIQELPKGIKVEVNTIYPTTIPLATFPANLLKKLPELPPELEYRIVGRDLILRDTKGNVIVDVMRAVFPIPT